MGMSTRVIAFISDKDETYQKHKAVLIACLNADIEELPKKTAKYFGANYVEEYLLEEKLEINILQTEWNDGDMSNGYEIKVSDIPEGVEIIRFVNSY